LVVNVSKYYTYSLFDLCDQSFILGYSNFS